MLTIIRLKVGPLAKKALKKRYDYKMFAEAAIMKLSMTRIDYASDKFGESVRAFDDLICATIRDLSSSTKLDTWSSTIKCQMILTLVENPFNHAIKMCHHGNFPEHKKTQCKRFVKGLPKTDYTVERKDKSVASKNTCAVFTPCTNILRPAVVMFQLMDFPINV
uniref:BRO1 domain-containing protein n=1 Tax=Strongyloides venezuelensis TaxID=75913 RepID=A0A0K0FGJ1_STRVS